MADNDRRGRRTRIHGASTRAPAGAKAVGPLSSLSYEIGRLADRTPADRDRVADAARAASIVVVVVWHWSLSINHRDGAGRLVNLNPIEDVPAGWSLTWFLQVMTVFFVVGGFANRSRLAHDRSAGGDPAVRGDGVCTR